MVVDPAGRMTCDELLDHSYFDHFRDWFQPELEVCVCWCVWGSGTGPADPVTAVPAFAVRARKASRCDVRGLKFCEAFSVTNTVIDFVPRFGFWAVVNKFPAPTRVRIKIFHMDSQLLHILHKNTNAKASVCVWCGLCVHV